MYLFTDFRTVAAARRQVRLMLVHTIFKYLIKPFSKRIRGFVLITGRTIKGYFER